MGVFFEFDDVDAFTVGTVGRPGERTFFLQARGNGQRVTLKCEKQQAAAIAQYLRTRAAAICRRPTTSRCRARSS